MQTAKQCFYGVQPGIGEGVFIVEYPLQEFQTWLYMKRSQDQMTAGSNGLPELTSVKPLPDKPAPLAVHVLRLSGEQQRYSFVYVEYFSHLVGDRCERLCEEDVVDLQFRLRVGLIEPYIDPRWFD